MSAHELLYVELDCPRCPHVFGVAPCTASSSLEPCKNTPSTCKSLLDYEQGHFQTVRWVKAADYVPAEPYAVPNINSVTINAQRINPGENLGRRERVSVSLFNHAHNDIDLDPYVTVRDYNPSEQGTYCGKFAALYPNVQGFPMRVLRGNTDLEYSEFEVAHYIADVGKSISARAGYSLTGKDVLDFAEGNKTLCPTPSNGILSAAITDTATSLTLSPAGIGDAEYPLSFDASIGDESMVCTRVGDVVTLVTRGAFFSTATAHNEGDTLQVMESFISKNASQILERLLSFTKTPLEYYNTAQWDEQVALVSSPSLTARIAEPTPVFTLIENLMQDLALDIHTDLVAKKIVMNFLVVQNPTLLLNDDNIINPVESLYEDKRVDLFIISFGRRNPLLKMDELRNYPATSIAPSHDPVSLMTGNPAAIRTQRSRWIPSTLRSQANQTGEFVIGRYERVPRGLMCSMKATMAPALAQVVNVYSGVFEDAYGRIPLIPMQVMSLAKAQGNYSLELEEFRAAGYDPDSLLIIVSLEESAFDMNGFASLRALYNSIYPGEIRVGSTIRFEASEGVVFGSNDLLREFAVDVGDWPEIDDIFLEIKFLTIAGMGGAGAYGASGGIGGAVGENGRGALKTRVPVRLIDCFIGGGGGGGGSNFDEDVSTGSRFEAAGGGGAGYRAGVGRYGAEDGELLVGGAGGVAGSVSGGYGGDLGQNGHPATPPYYAPGLAGIAIDGISYCTLVGTTSANIYGATIN